MSVLWTMSLGWKKITVHAVHAHISPLRGKFTEQICSLVPISVFYENIYSSSLRLFKIA